MSGDIRAIPFRPPVPGARIEVLTLDTVYRRAPRAEMVAAQRPGFQLFALVRAGEGSHVIDAVRHEVRPGVLLTVRPGQVHRFEPGADWDARLLLVHPSLLPPGGLPAAPAAVALGADRIAVERVFDELVTECGRARRSTADLELVRHLLSGVALRAARHTDRPLVRLDGGYAEMVRRYLAAIDASLARLAAIDSGATVSGGVGRGVAELAGALGYSARTLNRACQDQLGRSAKAVLDDRVVVEAGRLLTHTTLPLVAVARRLGFGEAGNFVRFYRRCTGVTPAAFRAASLVDRS